MSEAEVVHRTRGRTYVVGIACAHENDDKAVELFRVEHSRNIVGCGSPAPEKKGPGRLCRAVWLKQQEDPPLAILLVVLFVVNLLAGMVLFVVDLLMLLLGQVSTVGLPVGVDLLVDLCLPIL